MQPSENSGADFYASFASSLGSSTPERQDESCQENKHASKLLMMCSCLPSTMLCTNVLYFYSEDFSARLWSLNQNTRPPWWEVAASWMGGLWIALFHPRDSGRDGEGKLTASMWLWVQGSHPHHRPAWQSGLHWRWHSPLLVLLWWWERLGEKGKKR